MSAGEVGGAGAGEGAEEVFAHTPVLTRARAALVAVCVRDVNIHRPMFN